jgi:maleylacetoacetate isomerase/maleylpyruvate isomerase
MMGVIACDIHPVNNLRILQALSKAGLDETVRTTWAQRWINDGFAVLEPMIARHGQGFAFGATPTLADCCLIPQVYSSARFKVDLAPYPHIAAVGARAAQHPAFQAAEPHKQPDATP